MPRLPKTVSVTGIQDALDISREAAAVVKAFFALYPKYDERDILDHLNSFLDHYPPWSYGVENIREERDPYSGEVLYSYVNRGDTYTATVFFCHTKKKFFVSTLGDIVEHDRRLWTPDK